MAEIENNVAEDEYESITSGKKKSIMNHKTKKSELLVPVFGGRMSISGDFDGDGVSESITERYTSRISKKETNKNYENDLEYEDLVELIMAKKPRSYLVSSNPKIDTLQISSDTQLFGIFFMKNEGDLNGDGTDEISYVIDWADMSTLNTYFVVTFRKNKWIELASFPIWEWQFDELPNDAGLIKKIENSKIECYYRNKQSELDTLVLKLK